MPKAQRMKARADIANISDAVLLFKTDTGKYPLSLGDLSTPPQDMRLWDGPYLKAIAVPLDPWGRAYHYRADSSGFTITSYGADGIEGGTGKDADVTHREESAGR